MIIVPCDIDIMISLACKPIIVSMASSFIISIIAMIVSITKIFNFYHNPEKSSQFGFDHDSLIFNHFCVYSH